MSEEKMKCLMASEQQANSFLDDLKAQLQAQVMQSRVSSRLRLKLIKYQNIQRQ